MISTFYIILTLGVAAYLRRVVKNATKDNIFRQMLLELVATAELCAACFELIIGKQVTCGFGETKAISLTFLVLHETMQNLKQWPKLLLRVRVDYILFVAN